jgi:hypothetical protein
MRTTTSRLSSLKLEQLFIKILKFNDLEIRFVYSKVDMVDDDDDDEAMFDKFNPELVQRRKKKLEKYRAEKLKNIDPDK